MNMLILLAMVCWTNTEVTIVHPDKIKKAVQEYVVGRWGSSREEFLLEFRGLPSNIAAQSPDYSICVGIGSVPKLKGHVGIPIEIVSHGKVERRVVISIHVRTFGGVVVLGRQLQRHEGLAQEDILVQRLETTGLPDDVILDAKEIEAKRTVRIVSANTVLCRTMLERIPVVRPEDAVNIVVRAGNAIVSVQGVAKQEGCIGDMITVQRSGSHDRLRATIVNSRNVIVDVEGTARISQEH